MNFANGYTSKYYLEIVDEESWRGESRIDITGGKIQRTDDGLRGSADIDCQESIGERYVRVILDARQGDGGDTVALFTGLSSQPEAEWEGISVSRGLVCYSVLKAADDVQLQRGWYAPAGINGGAVIKNLLSVIPAPVEIVGITPPLETSIVAEDDETRLSMVDKILNAIGWRMRILGDGTIQILPYSDDAVRRFSELENDSIEPKLKITDDWFSCPNVFQAIADDLTAIVRDDDPYSTLSTVSRGREIWMTETDCDLNEDESIGEYARRMLKQEQARAFSVEYDRRYDPDIYVGDVIDLSYPHQNVVGKYRVDSQSISLGYNATTSEEVHRIE